MRFPNGCLFDEPLSSPQPKMKQQTYCYSWSVAQKSNACYSKSLTMPVKALLWNSHLISVRMCNLIFLCEHKNSELLLETKKFYLFWTNNNSDLSLDTKNALLFFLVARLIFNVEKCTRKIVNLPSSVFTSAISEKRGKNSLFNYEYSIQWILQCK